VVKELTPDMLAEFDGPMGLGHLVEVDTTRPVDIDTLATAVTRLLDTTTDAED
jgi:hypothetical protein